MGHALWHPVWECQVDSSRSPRVKRCFPSTTEPEEGALEGSESEEADSSSLDSSSSSSQASD